MKLVYLLTNKSTGETVEISRKKAMIFLQNNYHQNICTYNDMLNMVNVYPGMFYTLEIKQKDNN